VQAVAAVPVSQLEAESRELSLPPAEQQRVCSQPASAAAQPDVAEQREALVRLPVASA
jgi:hypothetical protein